MPDIILTELAGLVGDAVTSARLAPVFSRVQAALAAAPNQAQAWEPLPSDVFGPALPPGIQSCWVFVLRAFRVFGSERHPNSHQRTLAVSGSAEFEILKGEIWQRCPVDGGAPDRLSGGSISIPPNTWHRIRIGPKGFLCLSFHTVPAGELIEETPVGDNLAVTHRRLYQG